MTISNPNWAQNCKIQEVIQQKLHNFRLKPKYAIKIPKSQPTIQLETKFKDRYAKKPKSNESVDSHLFSSLVVQTNLCLLKFCHPKKFPSNHVMPKVNVKTFPPISSSNKKKQTNKSDDQNFNLKKNFPHTQKSYFKQSLTLFIQQAKKKQKKLWELFFSTIKYGCYKQKKSIYSVF